MLWTEGPNDAGEDAQGPMSRNLDRVAPTGSFDGQPPGARALTTPPPRTLLSFLPSALKKGCVGLQSFSPTGRYQLPPWPTVCFHPIRTVDRAISRIASPVVFQGREDGRVIRDNP